MRKIVPLVLLVCGFPLFQEPAGATGPYPGAELGFYGNYGVPWGSLGDRGDNGPGGGIKLGAGYIVAGINLSYTHMSLGGKADLPARNLDIFGVNGHLPLFGGNGLRYFSYVSLGVGYYALEHGGSGAGFNAGPGLMLLVRKPKPSGDSWACFLDASPRVHVFRAGGDTNDLLELRAGLTFFFDS